MSKMLRLIVSITIYPIVFQFTREESMGYNVEGFRKVQDGNVDLHFAIPPTHKILQGYKELRFSWVTTPKPVLYQS